MKPFLAISAFVGLACLLLAGCRAGEGPGLAQAPLVSQAQAKLSLQQLSPPVAKPADQPDPPGLPVQQVNQAEEQIRHQQYNPALRLLEPLAAQWPQSGRLQRALGLAYAGMGNQAKAEPVLQSAAKTAGDSLLLHLLLAQYASAEHPAQAIAELRAAILCSDAKPEDPDTGEAYFRLANLLERQGYLRAALDCYVKLCGLVDQHARKYLARPILKQIATQPERLLQDQGRLLLKLHDSADAADMLERAYQCDKSDPQTGRLAVMAILETRDYDRAEDLILEMAADSSQVNQAIELANELFRQHPQADASRRLVEDYLRRGGRETGFVLAMAEATAKKAGMRPAVALLNSHMSATSDSARLALRLADFHASLGEYDKALDLAVRCLQEDLSESEQAQDLLRRMGTQIDPGALSRLADQARNGDDNKAATLTAVAVMADGAERVDLAEELLQRAIDFDGDFLPAYLASERLYATTAQSKKIAKLLQRLSQAQPPEAFKYYLAALAAYDQGKLEEAMLSLQKSLSADQRPPATLLLGQTLTRLGASQVAMRDYPQAQEYLRQSERALTAVQETRSDDVNLVYALYELYMFQGRSEDALRTIQSFLAQSPRSAEAQAILGRFHLRMNQISQARQIAKTLKKDSADPEAQLLEVRIDLPESLPAEPLAASQANPAIARLSEILRRHPRFAPAARLLGALLVNQKQYARAVEIWKDLYHRQGYDAAVVASYLDASIKAGQQAQAVAAIQELATQPDSGAILQTLLLENLIDINRLDVAEQLLDRWLPKAPNKQRQDMLRARAVQVYSLQKKYDRAQATLDGWLNESPSAELRGRLRQQKMQLYMDVNQYYQAADYAAKWQRNEPNNPLPESTLLSLLIDAKQYDQALALADKWLAEDSPTKERAGRLYGSKELILARQKKFPALLAVHKQWLLAPCDAADPYKMILAVLAEQKQYDMALKIAQEWLDQQGAAQPSPQGVLESQRMYVDLLLSAERYAPAEEFARKLVNSYPQDPQALRLLYGVLSMANKQSQAMAMLERIYRLDSKDEGVNNDLGYQWADRGVNLDKAETMIRKALAARPTAAAFKDSLGWVLYKQGRFAEAKSVFDQVIDGDPSQVHPVILDHAGDNCWRLGLKEEALRLWGRALDMAKSQPKMDPDTRKVLDNTNKKIEAARQHREPKVAPLGQVPAPSAT